MEFPSFLRVAVVPADKIFEIHKDCEGRNCLKGIEANLLKTLSEGLNFTFELVEPLDSLWGSVDELGNWTGIVGMLKADKADLGLSYLDITESRMGAVDFSFPYDVADKTFATEPPQLFPSFATCVYPFNINVWISILSTYVAMCFVFIYLSRENTKWSKIFLGVFGTLCRQQYCVKEETYKWKMVFALWCIFVTVITSCYSAVLFSYLAIPLTERSINTVSELAASVLDGSYKCKITEGTHDLQILLGSKQKEFNIIGEKVLKNNWFYDTTNGSIANFLEPHTAIIANRALLSTMEFKNQYVSKDSFGVWNVGISFGKTFCCKERLNTMILRLLSSGIYQKHRTDVFFQTGISYLTEEPYYKLQYLELKDIYGVFFPLFFGYLISAAAFLCEIICYFVQKRNRVILNCVSYNNQ